MSDEELYRPKSDFLVMVANKEILFDDSEFGRANLQRLIALTGDADTSNRDWATMLLGHYGPNTEEVRTALLQKTKISMSEAKQSRTWLIVTVRRQWPL